MATSEIKFRRDTSFRKALFSPDSFAHPAKMDAQLLLWIVERYTKAGETILDPMAGSGTAMIGCTVGRNIVQVELEQKFVDMQKANWDKVRMMPQLGHEMGECHIIQGDARQLGDILADAAIFSPPYADKTISKQFQTEEELEAFAKEQYVYKHGRSLEATKAFIKKSWQGYPDNEENIGNLPYGDIDSIVTSPPYEAQISTAKSGIDWSKGQCYGKPRDRSKEAAFNQDSNFPSNFGNYGDNASNIGNLKADNYLSAMIQVYQQCHKVLKPGGLMIVVTKNFIRNKKEVRLDEDTIKLCEQARFEFIERHYRKLPAQSFWRVIYSQKYPDAPVLDKEDILVFKKVAIPQEAR